MKKLELKPIRIGNSRGFIIKKEDMRLDLSKTYVVEVGEPYEMED